MIRFCNLLLAAAVSIGLASPGVMAKSKEEGQIQTCMDALERNPEAADRICKPVFQILEGPEAELSVQDLDTLRECRRKAEANTTTATSDTTSEDLEAEYRDCRRVMNQYLKAKNKI